MQFSHEVESAIQQAAQQYGMDPELLRTFARIESGGRPSVRTGSYQGLFQLSPQEFAKHGGQGDIYNPIANTNAAALKLKAESAEFERQRGRAPTAAELYLIHQQGVGGAAAHWDNPDRPAWQNMASTAEGRQKGEGWAKQAIWGNVPDDLKRQYGSVDNLTSAQFVDMWGRKVGGGQSQPQSYASNAPYSAPMGLGAPREAVQSPRELLREEYGSAPQEAPSASPSAPAWDTGAFWEKQMLEGRADGGSVEDLLSDYAAPVRQSDMMIDENVMQLLKRLMASKFK